MKKILATIATIAVMFGMVSQAAAARSDVSLSIFTLDGTGNEIQVNLGSLADFGVNQTITNIDVLGLTTKGTYADDPAVDGNATLAMGAYFGTEDMNNIWTGITMGFATTSEVAPTANTNTIDNFYNGNNNLKTNMPEGSTVETYAASGNNAFGNRMNVSGDYAGLNLAGAADAPAILASLDDGGFVDMYLYEFLFQSTIIDYVTFESETTSTLLPGAAADYSAVIRLTADGDVIVNPINAEVPIPGALVLFASGIVGLIGIRRKNA